MKKLINNILAFFGLTTPILTKGKQDSIEYGTLIEVVSISGADAFQYDKEFIIGHAFRAVGENWLQPMNYAHFKDNIYLYPGFTYKIIEKP